MADAFTMMSLLPLTPTPGRTTKQIGDIMASCSVEGTLPLAFVVTAARGGGKTTFVDQFASAFSKDQRSTFVVVTMDAWHLRLDKTQTAPLPDLLYYAIAKEIERAASREDSAPPLSRQGLLEERDNQVAKLLRAAANLYMSRDEAGQVALAFADDEHGFSEMYAKTLQNLGAWDAYRGALEAWLTLTNKVLVVVIDDLDMFPSSGLSLLRGLAALRLARRVVTMVAAHRERLFHQLVQDYEGDRGWTAGVDVVTIDHQNLFWSLCGTELSLPPLSSSRQIAFINENRASTAVWSWYLTNGDEAHQQLVRLLTIVDGANGVLNGTAGVDLYLTAHRAQWPGEEGEEYKAQVNGMMNRLRGGDPDATFFSRLLFEFLPRNQREMVVATNALVELHDQWVKYPTANINSLLPSTDSMARRARLLWSLMSTRWAPDAFALLVREFQWPLIGAAKTGLIVAHADEIIGLTGPLPQYWPPRGRVLLEQVREGARRANPTDLALRADRDAKALHFSEWLYAVTAVATP